MSDDHWLLHLIGLLLLVLAFAIVNMLMTIITSPLW